MGNPPRRGHVEFRSTPAKLVADMPEDENMREQLDEMKENDNYQGSCGIISNKKK
ncbi:hypothetical protein ACVLD2_002880 [Paenibacillus sp. PvR052]|nr:hypothetical protein [Paenibacillus sp. PvP091]MBP1168203.1 hypothetical protein [Paenibacillus sp. PvR098]MBP2439231.1 hypothetical protein [Paenibacillus sp. PvP052]